MKPKPKKITDKQRLDWMQKNDIQVCLLWDGISTMGWRAYSQHFVGRGRSLRSAIDSAMRKEQK